MRNREKLTYKGWKELTKIEKIVAKSKLMPFQNGKDCQFGFNSKGEIVSVLDYGALAHIFKI